jgi:hypothetical protein
VRALYSRVTGEGGDNGQQAAKKSCVDTRGCTLRIIHVALQVQRAPLKEKGK